MKFLAVLAASFAISCASNPSAPPAPQPPGVVPEIVVDIEYCFWWYNDSLFSDPVRPPSLTPGKIVVGCLDYAGTALPDTVYCFFSNSFFRDSVKCICDTCYGADYVFSIGAYRDSVRR